MPYVTQENRQKIQANLDSLIEVTKLLNESNSNADRAGNLNYIITYMINELYPNDRYKELNDAIGVLECCKFEIYRRRVGPYEDLAIAKNGDVPNYPANRSTKRKKPAYKFWDYIKNPFLPILRLLKLE